MVVPRTAIIATRVYEPEGTAAAYRLGNLTRALERIGFQVTVLTSQSPAARRSSPQVRRWPVLRDRSGAVRGYLQYASFDLPLAFRLLFSRRVDVVVVEPPPTTGVVARVVCQIRRIPYVYFSADVTSAAIAAVGVNRLVVKVVTAMERWVLDGAAAVLAVTEGVLKELEELGTDRATITVVGTGIDTAQFAAEGEVEPVDHPYFIYAGTMSEFQGAMVFIDAFAKVALGHSDVRLVMFGGGVDRDALKERSRPFADQISFPGFVGAEVIARWTRGATASLASVRPGVGYDFALPTKTLASVACGTPVIFAGTGPLRELVASHGLGWSVDWDADQVAAAMREALNGLRRRLGPEVIQWLGENYSSAAVGDRAAAAVARVVDDAIDQGTSS